MRTLKEKGVVSFLLDSCSNAIVDANFGHFELAWCKCEEAKKKWPPWYDEAEDDESETVDAGYVETEPERRKESDNCFTNYIRRQRGRK